MPENHALDDIFKPKFGRDKEREAQRDRIFTDIVADCFTTADFQKAWYKYLNEFLIFPFQADIAVKINNTGEKAIKTVDILSLADETACFQDMLVKAETMGEYDYFFLPFWALTNIKGSESTRQAVEDWQFWQSDYF